MLGSTTRILELENVSKIYSRTESAAKRRLTKIFVDAFFSRKSSFSGKPGAGEFWAIKDINFNLKPGHAIGIIGLNGAGKTTLLRILAGQLLPDEGEVRMFGTSAAMIDLTSGFQMNTTGARNIFLKSALLGRSEKNTRDVFDSIVEFSELGDAINANLSTYSSGMLMRLAFSIIVSTEPDLLFIDEVLSVGDFRFRQKCMAKIRQLRKKTGFVLVSHSMNDIKNFCDEAILLHSGQVIASGEPDQVVGIYENMQIAPAPDLETEITTTLEPQFSNDEAVTVLDRAWCNSNLEPVTEIRSGDNLFFKVVFKMTYNPRHLIIGVPLWTEDGKYVTGFSNENEPERPKILANNEYCFLLKVPELALNPGNYISNLGFVDGTEFLFRISNPQLKVLANSKKSWGLVSVRHEWHLHSNQ